MGEWYTVNVLKKIKTFEVNVNTEFNINTILYNTTWFNPKLFYTYSFMKTTSNKFDSSITLIDKGGGVYMLKTNNTISNDSVCNVMVYEGDV